MKFCIIGFGVFGKNFVCNLMVFGVEVLVIDWKEENVFVIKDEVGVVVMMDFDDLLLLECFLISEMDVVIIVIGDDFEVLMFMMVWV